MGLPRFGSFALNAIALHVLSPGFLAFSIPLLHAEHRVPSRVLVRIYSIKMPLVRSQTYTFEIFDDQGPELMKTYSEYDWTHFIDHTGSWAEGTYTATTTPGASFSLTYEGA